MRLLLPLTLCAALFASTANARVARSSASRHGRSVVIEDVRGDKGSTAVRNALRDALARHMKRLGFKVVDGGGAASYRVRPTMLAFEAPEGRSGSTVEVKVSVVALDRKGRVAAMVEGGARTQNAPGVAPGNLESQAVEAAGRSIAEDLARRLNEAH